MKQALQITALSLLCGILLALYTQTGAIIRFVFSLAALLIGIYAFKRFEGIGRRVAFIAGSLFFFLVTVVFLTVLAYSQQYPDL